MRCDAELRLDPAGVYSASDFITRDRCRKEVEQIARHSGLEEPDVARLAVSLAASLAAKGADAVQSQVAYYLLDDGIQQLEHEAHASTPLRVRTMRLLRRHATQFYLGGIAAITACLLALAVRFAVEEGVHRPALLVIPAALALFPLSELVHPDRQRLVISLFPPEPLPKMDFRRGHSRRRRHAGGGPDDAFQPPRQCARRWRSWKCASGEPGTAPFFSLFSDFTDSREPCRPATRVLLESGACRHRSVEYARYPGEHFLLFHRQRLVGERAAMDRPGTQARQDRGSERILCAETGPDGLLLPGSCPARSVT